MMTNTAIRAALLACVLALVCRPLPLRAQAAEPAPAEPQLAAPAALAMAIARSIPSEYEQVGAGGPVRVRVLVDTAGKAESVTIASSTGYGRLDSGIRQAVRSARYVPVEVDGQRARAWADLTLHFGNPRSAELDPGAPVNGEEVRAAAQSHHPAELKVRNISASVPLLLTIDADGRVASQRSPEPGCFPSATRAAQDLAKRLLFEPAGDGPRTRQIAATVSFGDTVRLLLRGDSEPQRERDPAEPRDPREEVEPTGRTARPELTNQVEVRKALVKNYPDNLRKQGRGGTSTVWVSIDERGRVQRRQIGRTSGLCELDLAALEVAAIMHFTPAVSRGRPQAVTVEIPIIFASH
jgi:TonB family protein